MSFPVLGQFFGILWIFVITFYFTRYVPQLISNYSFLNNVLTVFSLLLLITLPGFILFAKAFWDFMISYVVLNNFAAELSASKKSDLNQISNFKFPVFQYIILLIILSLICLIPIAGLILLVFSSLSFQIFALDEEKNPTFVLKKSFQTVYSNFFLTITLILSLYFLTYEFLPKMFIWLIQKIEINDFLVQFPLEYLRLLGLGNQISFSFGMMNFSFDILEIAQMIMTLMISGIVIAYTLPLRSICFTLYYQLIYGKGK